VVVETSLPTSQTRSLETSIVDYLGFENSILNSGDSRDLELETIHYAYYVMLPAMLLVACWVQMNYNSWLKKHGKELSKPFDREVGPRQMTLWFDRIHPQAMRVRNGVTTSAALDVVYSMPRYMPFKKIRSVGDLLLWVWLNIPDAQGPRNRLRLTFKELIAELERLKSLGRGIGDDFIEILSLACGSAQATIEAIAFFIKTNPGINIRLLLVDQNGESLGLAKELANRRGIGDLITTKEIDIIRFLHSNSQQWDIIEMVGYLDYRTTKSLVRFCKMVKKILRKGGLFLTAHIAPSPIGGAYVVRWVTNWPGLIRRSKEVFVELLIESGFNADNIRGILDPTHTHTVASCRN
jgi:hypothetical protein